MDNDWENARPYGYWSKWPQQLATNKGLAGDTHPSPGVVSHTPLSQSEVTDDPESTDSGRVADGPDAGTNRDESIPASVGGVRS